MLESDQLKAPFELFWWALPTWENEGGVLNPAAYEHGVDIPDLTTPNLVHLESE